MKRVLAILVSLVMGLGLVAIASPASAAIPTSCTSGWSTWYTNGFNGGGEGGWGEARLCYAYYADAHEYWWQFQVYDTLTDGYAVHLEACTDQTNYFPYSCTNPGQGYNPLFGLILSDATYAQNGDHCIQSSGSVATSQFPAIFTPDHAYDPTHSYFVVQVVRGRCEGGAYQNVGHFELLLSY